MKRSQTTGFWRLAALFFTRQLPCLHQACFNSSVAARLWVHAL